MPTSVPSRQPMSAKPILANVSALARPESRPASMNASSWGIAGGHRPTEVIHAGWWFRRALSRACQALFARDF